MNAGRAVWLAVLLSAIVSTIVTYAIIGTGSVGSVSCTMTVDGRSGSCDTFTATLPRDAGKWTGGRG